MTDYDRQQLRAALNLYKAADKEAAGLLNGRAVTARNDAEKKLRRLMWHNREALVDAVTEMVS